MFGSATAALTSRVDAALANHRVADDNACPLPWRKSAAISVNLGRAGRQLPDAHEALAAWFGTASGQALARRETAVLRERVRRFHGDCLLMLGPVPETPAATARCMVRTRIFAAARADGQRHPDVSTVVAAAHALPVAQNSVDGVVLHHALECAPDPRAAMREVARVVRPGGRLLVCCFNPLSLWSLGALRRRASAVTAWRLNDWLAVLGFREAETTYLRLRASPTLRRRYPRWADWRRRLDRTLGPVSGVVYVTLAIKDALGTAPQADGFAAGVRGAVLSAPGAAKLAAFSPRLPNGDDAG